MGHDTLEARDGWLYIVMHESMDSEPTMLHVWYPLGVQVSNLLSAHSREACGQAMTYKGGGTYTSPTGLCYRLTEGGQTRPTFYEREPIPRPKSRSEMRWREGRWQKYVGRRWVAA